jgi:hypothetical protein
LTCRRSSLQDIHDESLEPRLTAHCESVCVLSNFRAVNTNISNASSSSWNMIY